MFIQELIVGVFTFSITLVLFGMSRADSVPFLANKVGNPFQCLRLCEAYTTCHGSDFDFLNKQCYLYSENFKEDATLSTRADIAKMYSRKSQKNGKRMISNKPGVCQSNPCREGEICVATMSGTSFICLPAPECKSPIERSGAEPGPISKRYTGKEVTYSCKHGYSKTRGDGLSVCKQGGDWSTPTLECLPVDCGSPPDIDNMEKGQPTGTILNSSVVYSCALGYDVSAGDGESRCAANGSWGIPSLVCQLVDCGVPLDRDNMKINLRESTTYSTTIIYQCDLGYFKNYGTGESECLATGYWSDPTLKCELVDCGVPLDRDNMKINLRESTTYSTTIIYQCDLGYVKKDGTGESECLATGYWSDPTLKCELVDCGTPPTRTGMNLTLVSTTYNTTYHSYIQYECALGYRDVSRQDYDDRSMCGPTGDWSEPNLQCEVKDKLITVATASTTDSQLTCVTKNLTVTNSPVGCDAGQVLVHCSVFMDNAPIVGGVEIIAMEGGAGCKLHMSSGVSEGGVRCCSAKDLECEYFHGAQSPEVNDGRSAVTCPAGFELLGCTGNGTETSSQHDGTTMLLLHNGRSKCVASNGYQSIGVIANAACCRAPGLSCDIHVESESSGYVKIFTETCAANTILTACTSYHHHLYAKGTYFSDAGCFAHASHVYMMCCKI